MKPFAVLCCSVALVLSAVAPAEEKASTTGDAVQKAKDSKTAKDLSAKGLAKIGMDITPSAPGAKVYFIEPNDKAEVKSPVKVVFGLSGMGVAPKGVQSDNTGHHHVLIDNPQYDPNAPLPQVDQIKHFGGGQTEGTLELKPGKHTLQLLLGDWKHQPHNPPVMSDPITITVK